MAHRPRFPIYIPSKGRWHYAFTMRVLDKLGGDYRVIVEAQEADEYARSVGRERILVLDPAYQRGYDDCDELGDSKSHGPGPARNFAWDHADVSGADWHWVMDDSINGFFRYNRNLKIPVGDMTVFRIMEDFALRYDNVAMCGPNYEHFVKRRDNVPPFALNTRIYSCNLIRNDVPYRWRARYNEDTDLSLRMLKDGWCTVLFNAFLMDKVHTQEVEGGNTDAFYATEGTLPKTEMLIKLHPDVARFAEKFDQLPHYHNGVRVHHHVDYSGFKQRLRLKPGVVLPTGTNDYGMRLISGEQRFTAFGRHPAYRDVDKE